MLLADHRSPEKSLSVFSQYQDGNDIATLPFGGMVEAGVNCITTQLTRRFEKSELDMTLRGKEAVPSTLDPAVDTS